VKGTSSSLRSRPVLAQCACQLDQNGDGTGVIVGARQVAVHIVMRPDHDAGYFLRPAQRAQIAVWNAVDLEGLLIDGASRSLQLTCYVASCLVQSFRMEEVARGLDGGERPDMGFEPCRSRLRIGLTGINGQHRSQRNGEAQ